MPRHDEGGGGEATPLSARAMLCCSLRVFQPKKHLKREMFSDFLCTTYVLITYCAAAAATAANSFTFSNANLGMLRRLFEATLSP